MKTKLVPALSHPCSQNWNTMQGNDQRRFCDHCQLHVHNLSAMSPAGQTALLSERSGRRCVAYLAGPCSIRVRTGTWLLLQRLLRPWRAGLAFLALLLPTAFSGCATVQHKAPSPTTDTHDCKQVRELPDGKFTVGGVMCEPPLWRRILFFWQN